MGAPLYESTATTKGNPSPIDYKIARQLVMRGGDYDRAFSQLNLTWKELPGALQELEQLGNLFFLKKHRSRIFKQADATEANLQRFNKSGLLAKYRYLVFSAQGT
jgi:hypothetical protein